MNDRIKQALIDRYDRAKRIYLYLSPTDKARLRVIHNGGHPHRDPITAAARPGSPWFSPHDDSLKFGDMICSVDRYDGRRRDWFRYAKLTPLGREVLYLIQAEGC